MKSSTRQLLAELREDHRNMAVVLNVLEKTANSAESGDDPDFELIDEIMHYMTVYPDAVHHPKEDIVYAELQTNRPDLATGLEDVPEDHWQIAALGTQLHDDVKAIVAGTAVRREQLVADLQQYVDRLRNHMRWEETDLFPRVDKMLDTDSHEFAVGQFMNIKDPVFELEVEGAFRRLMASLKTI